MSPLTWPTVTEGSPAASALVVGLLVLMPLVYSRGIQAGVRRAEIQSRRDMLLDLKSQAILDPTLSDRYVRMLEELIRHQ